MIGRILSAPVVTDEPSLCHPPRAYIPSAAHVGLLSASFWVGFQRHGDNTLTVPMLSYMYHDTNYAMGPRSARETYECL